MPDIERIEDSDIENLIKDNQVGTPDPSTTSGGDLQDLIKALRDRFEQELTKLTTDYTTIDTRVNNLETHYKGVFVSLASLQAAFPTAAAGDYANIDPGTGNSVVRYIWDDTDSAWVVGGGTISDFASNAETIEGIINDKAVQPQGLEAKFDATTIYFSETDFLGTGTETDPLNTKNSVVFSPEDFSGVGSINEPIRIKFTEFLEGLPGWVEDGSKVLTSNLTWQVNESYPLMAKPGLMSSPVSETEIQNNFTAPANSDGPVNYQLQLASSPDFSNATTVYNGTSTEFDLTSLAAGTTYYLRLRASGSGFSTSGWTTAAVTTLGTASGNIVETTVLVNFANQYFDHPDTGPWNHVRITLPELQGAGYTKTNLKGSENWQDTGISILLDDFDDANNSLSTPVPPGSAIYPDIVISSGIYKNATSTDGLIRLYGLDPGKFYTVYIMGNTSEPTDTAVFTFTSGSQSVTKTVGGNNFQAENLAELTNISGGQTSLDIYVTKVSGVWNAGISSIAIEVSDNYTPIINAPGLLSAAISETAIENNFTAPDNITGDVIYELQLADNAVFNNATIAYNGLSTQFNITALIPGTTYYIRLRALKSGYIPSAWTTATVTTQGTAPNYSVETTVLINFANQYLNEPEGPWNQAKITYPQLQGAGYTKTSLKGSENWEDTGISIFVLNFEDVNNSLSTPVPPGTGIYPDFVIYSGIYKNITTTDGLIRLYGLNPNKFYTVYLMGNTSEPDDTAVFTYIVGSQSVTKTIGGNNFQMGDIAELKNISNGQTSVDILVRKVSGVFHAGVSSLVLQVSNLPKP